MDNERGTMSPADKSIDRIRRDNRLNQYYISENVDPPDSITRRDFVKVSLVALGVGVLAAAGIGIYRQARSEEEMPVLLGSETADVYGIKVAGRPEFLRRTQSALDLLKPTIYWDTDVQRLEKIADSTASVIFVQREPTFYVGQKTWTSSTVWYASSIAHDAHHIRLYQEAIELYGDKADPELWSGPKGETLCMQFQIDVLRSLNAPTAYISRLEQIIKEGPTYQDVPLDKRDW
jgi:hypothetical protein